MPRHKPPTAPRQDDAPKLGDIAYDAEQQAYNVQAIVQALIEACADDDPMRRCLHGIARLLTPVCDQLSVLAWELLDPAQAAQPSHPPAEEAK